MPIPEPRLPADAAALTAAIDRHIEATSTTLTQTLALVLASLAEPHTTAPERALQRLGLLIETLLGVAAGAVIGRVVSAVLRGFGSEVGFMLELRLREALVGIGPGRRPAVSASLTPARSPYVKDAAARPLVDELGARLSRRLAQAGAEHRAVLTQLATAIPPARVGAFRSTLEVLEADALFATQWSMHLSVAWRFYAIAVASGSDAEPALQASSLDRPAHATWSAWLRRVRGEPPVAAPPARPHGDDCILAIVA